jgi:NAD(P)-dependent dehydrogenase (short-subunit alcohol dehydrogenase family)
MKDYAGRTAVVTGGGTGIGRELVRQLAGRGCHVAACDVAPDTLAETLALVESDGTAARVRVTTHIADVSNETDFVRFRDEYRAAHGTDQLNLLFNNAGIGGGGSFIADSRDHWERTFRVCWDGVYLGVRTFFPLLVAADEARIVNTSSLMGLWASIGPATPHTAYAAAKFAVRGFSEALIADLAVHAPHVGCTVVFPGHVGTSISTNTRRYLSGDASGRLSDAQVAATRARLVATGRGAAELTDEAIQASAADLARRFRDEAPVTAAAAAATIFDGISQGRWRILIGEDARIVDEMVRADPEAAYTPDFFAAVQKANNWNFGG